jgi:hypothetical protein
MPWSAQMRLSGFVIRLLTNKRSASNSLSPPGSFPGVVASPTLERSSVERRLNQRFRSDDQSSFHKLG